MGSTLPTNSDLKMLAMMRTSTPMVVIAILCLLITAAPAFSANDKNSANAETLARYETEMASGNEAAALKHLLEYTTDYYGENSPQAVQVTRRYGHQLFRDGRYRAATDTLKIALERSTAVYGESGGEAFEICMNIAHVYSQWEAGLVNRLKYFNRALEVLRDQGKHQSITYVNTLITIAVNLMDSGHLGGSYSSHISDTMYSPEAAENVFPIEHEYRNNYGVAERYILEAVEIAKLLEDEDEYISAKIAIAQAKLKVLETVELDAVPMGVSGYISGGTAREYYDEEEARVLASIEKLSQDIDANKVYLKAANKILMEIAWIDKDNDRMLSMCSNGTLNSAGDYPPDRLYEVMEGGIVLAPDLPMSVNRNLFKRRVTRRERRNNRDETPEKRPYFTPVCVDGELMAALVNVPRVTVEELGERRP